MVSAVCAVISAYAAWKTINASLLATREQRVSRELEKDSTYFNAYVVQPVHAALAIFLDTAPSIIEKYQRAIIELATGAPEQSVDPLIQRMGDEYRTPVFALRAKLRFARNSFGEGDGTLWPRIEEAVTALEDGVQELISELHIPAKRRVNLESEVRDRAGRVMQALYRYDRSTHAVTRPSPGRLIKAARWLGIGGKQR